MAGDLGAGQVPDATRERRDPPAFLAYFAVVVVALVLVAIDGVVRAAPQRGSFAFIAAWCVFCAVANVLPVPTTKHISLSMGAPVNVAVAFLFPPAVAAAIVFVSSLTEWELKRETTLLHAAFNRGQLALATAVASYVLEASTVERWELPPVPVVVVMVVAYQLSNWGLVALAEWTARATPFRQVLRGLVPASPAVAATYLLLGFMGLVLALTSVRVGAWGVALVMLPLLGARQAVNASRQLEQAERERRSLADHLIDERERERLRIAGDIHDVVLQQLAALQLEADSIQAALEHDQPRAAVRLAHELRTGVDDTIRDLRATIASLRRTTIDDAGLAVTLERFARSAATTMGVDIDVSIADDVGELPLPVSMLLFECYQEALTNVARHAEATAVRVRVVRSGDNVELVVEDDGRGFVSAGSARERSGLVLSREKVSLSGGLLFVDSAADKGTTVTVRVPARLPS